MCISDGSYTRCISIVGNMFCISKSISAKLNVRETYTSCINSKQKQECTRKKVLQKTKSFLQKFVGEKKLETIFVQIVWQTKVGNEFCIDLLANKS